MSTTTLTYDNNGNLTGDGRYTNTWDYRNQLTQTATGTATSTYAYDHERNRVKLVEGGITTISPNKFYNVMLGGAATSTKHIFANGLLIATMEMSANTGGGSATSTGFKTAGTINESTGFTNFTTTRLGSSDNSYATSLTTDPLGRISTFGFSIPSGATINGVEVTLEAKVSFGTIGIPFSLSWNNGTSFTTTKSNTITTTEAVYTYGGSTDTWGRTWTDSELADGTFQVKINPPSSAFSVSYDQIRAKVYYTPTGTTTASSTIRYIITDHLGGTNVVTSATGTVVQVLDYYPYGGTRINNSTGGFDEKKKFAGMERDSVSGLDYAQNRFYANTRGQFISEDPAFLAVGDPAKLRSLLGQDQQTFLSNPQQMNSYSWAQDNPINKSDPTGLGDGTMGFFNSYYPNYPASVVQQIQQAKYDAIKVGVGLPFATLMGGGILSSAVLAPEFSPALGAAYQGALVNVGLRATNDFQTGSRSSPLQYGGSAVLGGVTGAATFGRSLITTVGVSAFSAGVEGRYLDGGVQTRQVASNAVGAGAGQFAGNLISSVPAFRSVAPILGPAVNSLTTFGVTALSTAAFISTDKKK